jgi:ABC-2 type transport system permease protein
MEGTTDRSGWEALPPPGARRFGRVNWLGLWTLYAREVWRFAKIWGQTLLAPLATAGLFMAVFHFALADRRGDVGGVPFTAFLAPGVLMMTVVQNAFGNTSSSLIIAKVQGNIVDTLMPPLSPGELVAGYALSGATRGVAVGVAVGAPVFWALDVAVAEPLWAVAFLLAGALVLSLAGLIVGVLCWKFDQMAAITNFVVTPLAFLSGTFYSVADLPQTMQTVSRFNPVFHLIDGFRYGVLGASDGDPATALALAAATAAALWAVAWAMFRRGVGLKA